WFRVLYHRIPQREDRRIVCVSYEHVGQLLQRCAARISLSKRSTEPAHDVRSPGGENKYANRHRRVLRTGPMDVASRDAARGTAVRTYRHLVSRAGRGT